MRKLIKKYFSRRSDERSILRVLSNFIYRSKNNMRKSFRTNLTMTLLTAGLMLALIGIDARANGQLGTGSIVSPPPADGGGGLGSGNLTGSTSTTASDGGGTLGSGSIMATIGEFLIGIFG